MEQAKLLSTTALLTLLIWIGADSLVNETVRVPISFRALAAGDNPDRLVASSADAESYELQVIGSRKAIAQVQAAAPLNARLQIPDLPSGTHLISLKEILQEQWREFPKVSVLSVNPPQLPVVVDHIVAREVVLTTQRLSLPYDVKPQIQPSTVTVRMRESVAAASQGQLAPWDISTEVEKLLRGQPVGQSVSVLVTLDARTFGPDASLAPNTVEVRATLTALRTTTEIPTVPILIAVSFANFPKALRAVTRDESELVTQTIKVTGSTEEVGRLLRGETRAIGIIQLKDEHLAEVGVFKPYTPDFQLPIGIELAEKPKPIELKLVAESRPDRQGDMGP